MSRPWGKQFAHMLGHPKYLRASIAARAAWHTLFLVALNSPTEEVLGTREDVEAILRNYGFGEEAGDCVRSLVDLRLIDVRSGVNGKLKLHDWNHWQPDDPTGAKRKAASRAAKASGDSPQPVNGLSRDSHALEEMERRGDSTPPKPPRQRGGRKKATTGQTYDHLIESDATADPAWLSDEGES